MTDHRDHGDETPEVMTISEAEAYAVRVVGQPETYDFALVPSSSPLADRLIVAVMAAARDVVEQAIQRNENSACINLYWLDSLRAALRAAGVEMEK